MIPAIIGWFVPSIAGWVNGWRQRRNLGRFITELSVINKKFQDKDRDKDENIENIKAKYLNILDSLQGTIQNALTKGKISESQYQILVNTISYYQKNPIRK